MQVYRIKHMSSNSEEKCTCIFQITWISGPNVKQHANVKCASIYIPEFGNIENHSILKEAKKFLEDQLVRTKKRLRTIIAEDENGFIVLKNVISEY